MSEPQTTEPAPVLYHWIMTVQTDDGRQATNDGTANVLPGIHSQGVTYSNVLTEMKKWMGTEQATVVFYRLVPNAIPIPTVTA